MQDPSAPDPELQRAIRRNLMIVGIVIGALALTVWVLQAVVWFR